MSDVQVWEVAPHAPVYVRDGHKTIDATPPWRSHRYAASTADWDALRHGGRGGVSAGLADIGVEVGKLMAAIPFGLIDPTTLRITPSSGARERAERIRPWIEAGYVDVPPRLDLKW